MLHRINPTQTQAWKNLKNHYLETKSDKIKDLFKKDAQRFEALSIRHQDLLIDYSKNRLTLETINLLIKLAKECGLPNAIHKMFSGKSINETEDRAVLHTALRQQSNDPIKVNGENIIPKIRAVQAQMKSFAEKFHQGEIRGYLDQPLTQIVNIGIGGSDLGPVMVTEALKPYWKEGIETYFVSNIDGTHI